MSWNDVVLTAFSASSPMGAVVMGALYFRQNKRRKNLENDRLAVENAAAASQVRIDDVTRSRLIEEAATINQGREQRREDWWTAQISVLRGEIDAERRLSNRRFRRLNQLEYWATRHVIWDRRAWSKIREIDPDFEAPPSLPDESPDDYNAMIGQ